MTKETIKEQAELLGINVVSGSSFRKDSYTLAEVKEIARNFTRAATPSKYIRGIDERFDKVWKINFGG
tara:strand:- start:319 stop:522 length:204 start_codon:yes stop_codon:yes gene_type:complete